MGSLSWRNKKLRIYSGGVFIWENDKLRMYWGGVLSVRKKKLRMYWGGVFIWEKKKLRMYWGGVFIWEKEENEDVLGWGPFGKTTTTATENVPLMKFIYLVFFTSMPGENYRRRLRSLLLYVCYVHRALITSLVC